ncbi:MAG: GTPase domain-containing protein, partial [Kineosporiaceae bacterium]|nr:GTPase domain-containing protein [Kineosporiaceae bacterium]MBK7621823.1 GTPase domain-containing protein [Kineosporiaceae bacterium]
MTTDIAGLQQTAVELRGALASLHLDTALPGATAAGRDAAAMVREFDDHVLPRLGNLEAPALVVIGGSTGSGKSLLTNSVLGADVTRPGYLRPTTMAPVLVHDPVDAAWFQAGHVLPNLARVLEGEAKGHRELRLVASDAVPDGVALLDSPDIDSVSVANRELAADLLAAADLWIFVTTAARYADAVPWDFLRSARRRGTPLVIVMNRTPPEGAQALAAHLSQMLAEEGLPETPVITVTEQPLVEGRLPAGEVAPLRDWLDRLGADHEARAASIRRSLQGALADLAARTHAVSAAVDEQVQIGQKLLGDVDAAYADALTTVRKDIDAGALLRGEVLARWEELLGTGELFRQLRTGLSKLRDQVAGLLTGRRRTHAEFTEAVEHVVQTLIRTHGDAAAADVASRWRARPGGDRLIAADVQGRLARSSAELDSRAAAAVRAWQGELLELVRNVGGDRKSTARVLSLGVNGVAAVVMMVVFAHTGGLTGAEAAVAGGASAVGHTLLEALLGDQAIRTLANQAREALDSRVAAVYHDEAERYRTAVASLGIDAEAPARLDALADALARGSAAGGRA